MEQYLAQEPKNESVISIKDFPADLHRSAKVEAAKRGIPLRELIIEAIRAAIRS